MKEATGRASQKKGQLGGDLEDSSVIEESVRKSEEHIWETKKFGVTGTS